MRYGFKKRAKPLRDNDYHVRCIFPDAEHAEEYRNWEANKSYALKKLFSLQERLILYLKYMYRFGYKRIRNCTGISERKVRQVFYKAYTIAKYENQSFVKPRSTLDFKYTSKKR